VNRAIGRVYAVLASGLVLLLGFTAYWQLWAEPSLAARRDNAHQVVQQLSIRRGLIFAADGTKLAVNRATKTADGRHVYERRYPTNKMFAHVVGYSSATDGRAGVERSANDYLIGAHTDLGGALENQLHSLAGGEIHGDDVQLSLLPAAQRKAMSDLAATGKAGAVFAVEPRTGRVLVSASWPSFNPNRAVAGSLPRAGSALVNRATQGLYPPGSSIKPVIAALALESGRANAQTKFNDPGYFEEYGKRITNDNGERFSGTFDLTYALTHSINSVFARLGSEICGGRARCPVLTGALQKLGFYSIPPLDYPTDQLSSSGTVRSGTHTLLSPNAPIDPARTAIGQANLVVTPMQMAMVAAAIGNGGVVMKPTLVDSVRSSGGALRYARHSQPLDRAFGEQTAAAVTEMMKHVVDEGTGQAAQIPGVQIAGKTGTAQTGRNGQLDAWFISFAPAENPQVAVAVVVERTNQYGGQAAAPIARDVMQAVLNAAS
jgi:peptidoglycan glycosyltransferase